MTRLSCAFLVLIALLVATPPLPSAAADKPPIRALLVTGGCCHDYERQKLILTKGISARANVVWTVVHQGGKTTNAKIPLYEDPDWAKGFDVVVHNECFANVPDKAWVERILKPHRDGVPAILIHCAMHCYRTGDDTWFEFVGLQSPRHGAQYAYKVENIKKDHPIMQGLGEGWTTPKGELYHTVKLFPKCTPLAQARRQDDNQPQTCAWTNQYGKARVFGTTIGHHNETMADPKYLDMVTRGLLWSVGRLEDGEFHATNEKTDAEIMALIAADVGSSSASALPGKCCGDGNLLSGKPAKASSEETGKNNFAGHAVDGNLATRWCASGGKPGEWWQVDLEKPADVTSLRIHWEKENTAYQYKVDASADGETWQTIVDQSANKQVARITPHQVDAAKARFLRITFLGASTNVWGSFWEVEAYAGALPELPKSISSAPAGPAASIADVQAPAGFEVRLFGSPPTVNYPVCLTAAPTGEVFVGVDEQGSLGKEPGGGRVLRCIDVDGDGQADKINTFVDIDHPRGLIYDNGSLWVLHPPYLSVHHDDNGDGVADRHETLITGISTDQVNRRGADHTTNGIRMGIDGWIYIAVGDFGFSAAKGTDGTTLSRRGGGIVRVRPDGTEMEVFAWGLRNILDVCIDPYMNVFTRDNTNDGGGWDIRLSHVLQTGEYGYPSLYMNFADEIMPPLADYGGGSGCGGMFLHDARWPAPYGNAVYTCDWGRSEVYLHNLPAHGATFDAHQEVFLKIPRPTDIDVDGSGRMYVSSWKNGSFNFSGPNVGFVAQIVPKDFVPKPFPRLDELDDTQLVAELASPSAAQRLHVQREILRRRAAAEKLPEEQSVLVALRLHAALVAMASVRKNPLYARVAAIFTLKQLHGAEAHSLLLKLAQDDAVREFALRALTDRKSELKGVLTEPFVAALNDENPRVRAQALISLGRLGKPEIADKILPLTQRPKGSPLPDAKPLHKQPDADRVLPHLAVRALASLAADEACVAALDGPQRDGALSALRTMHDEKVIDGLIQKLNRTTDPAARRELLATLIRLYHREGEYTNSDWWGTRPDTSGPYYDRKTWPQSSRIAQVVRTAAADGHADTAAFVREQLARHKVQIDGLPQNSAGSTAEAQPAIELPKFDKNDPSLVGNLPFEKVAEQILQTPGDAQRGKALFTQQSCIACHTYADGQTPKGPHLVDIGKRYKRAELIESLLKPSAKIAQGFDTYSFITTRGKVISGFIVSEGADVLQLRQNTGVLMQLPKDEIDEQTKQPLSMMPEGLINNLKPQQLADLLAYLESLE